MAQLDQNLCRRKTKKKGKIERERKEREDRCLQMSSNQTHLTKNSLSLSHSVTKPIKNMFTRNTLLQPPKKSHLHHCLNFQKKHFFHRVMWASLGFLCLGQSFHRENRKARTFLSLSLFLSLFSCLSFSYLSLYTYSFLLLFLAHISFFLPSHQILFFLPFSLSLVHISLFWPSEFFS